MVCAQVPLLGAAPIVLTTAKAHRDQPDIVEAALEFVGNIAFTADGSDSVGHMCVDHDLPALRFVPFAPPTIYFNVADLRTCAPPCAASGSFTRCAAGSAGGAG